MNVTNTGSPAAHIGGSVYYFKIGQTSTNSSPRFDAIGSSVAMPFAINGSEAARIDLNGRLLIGTTASKTTNSHTPALQISGDNYSKSTVQIINNANDSTGAYLFFGKQRSGSVGGNTIAVNGDIVGQLRFSIADGTDMENQCAQIQASVDGVPGSNDTPGRLQFYTTPDNSATLTERLRITSTGKLQLSNSDGIQLSAQTSTLYAVDGTLSYYSTSNGVYLNGAGASGWLRLSAAGTSNNQTSMNLYGGSYGFGSGGQIDFRTDSTERLRIKTDGKIIAKGVRGGSVHNVSTADVEIGGRHIWNRIESSNHATTSGAQQFKIKFFRTGSGNVITCYYRGVVVNVTAGGRYDWGGHGYVTHSSSTILMFSGTTGGSSRHVHNEGYNHINNTANGVNHRISNVTYSYDSSYLYATFSFDTNLSGTGFKPYYNIEVIDPSQCTYDVEGI